MRKLLALALVFGVAGFVFADDRAEAEKKLDAAIASQNKEQVKSALHDATSAGDLRAAKVIIADALKLRGIGVHEDLLAAIKGITEEAGVKELADAAKKNPQADLRYLLVEGLAQHASEVAQHAVLDGLDDKDDQVAVVAARSARSIKTPECVERLMARCEKAEPKPAEATIARETLGALKAITGLDLNSANEFKSWWHDHKTGWTAPSGDAAAKPEGEGTTSVDRLKKIRPEDAHTIERLGDDDIIVVKGHSDQISDVLKAIKIHHKEIAPEDVAKTKLDPKSILILNCNSKLNPYGESEFAKIREFVDRGGYLFTSDWQLEFLFPKVFQGSISLDKKVGSQALTVPIVAAAPKHPLMRDVFPMGTWDQTAFVWHIDSHSELIKIDSPGITVLVKSPELEQKFQNSAVAVTFRWHNGAVVTGQGGERRTATGGSGKGHTPAPDGGCVLHVLGHFKHQKDKDSGDHFALQQLLLNFILEKKHGEVPAKGN